MEKPGARLGRDVSTAVMSDINLDLTMGRFSCDNLILLEEEQNNHRHDPKILSHFVNIGCLTGSGK